MCGYLAFRENVEEMYLGIRDGYVVEALKVT